jgi:pSer/pThr/pTyr-binding forkhead associated (FHA) protein
VSRAHCKLYEQDGQTVVEDLKSLNGTFVNNRRIQEPTPLTFGQLLTIGDVTFRVMQDSGAAKGAIPEETPVPEETEATVHAPTARPAMPDFTVAVAEEIPAGELVEEGTEASPSVASEPNQPKPAAPGIPNLPKFAPRRPRF